MVSSNILSVNKKFAFYDSGIGGLTVVKPFISALAGEFFYLGDSARAPYGEKSKDELICYVYEACEFMHQQKVDYFISACNTSSIYFNEIDFSAYNFQVKSLFQALKDYFKQNQVPEINLIATSANIAAAKFLEFKTKVNPFKCPKLVPLIENGECQQAAQVLKNEYLANANLSLPLVLGCTHYAYLKPYLSDFNLLDPAEIIFQQLISSENLAFKNADALLAKSNYKLKAYCTGDISSFTAAIMELKLSLEK